METRRIGSLEVSVVGLGCNNFGGRLDAGETASVVDAALDAGVNFLDTADIYGKTLSETYLGQALRGRRGRVVLASKFGMKVDDERHGARPEYIVRACEDSLRRLDTDYLDLYQLHTPDPTVPIADTLGALGELVEAGKVREIGCSNFSAAQLWEAETAGMKGVTGFVSVQNEYSMIHREPERGVLEACEDIGIAFIPYFPLASGLLTGKYRRGQPAPQGARLTEGRFSGVRSDENLELVERLIAFAEARGHTLLELAFGWLLTRAAVASVIAGATKPEQARGNAAAAAWRPSAGDLAELDGILPPA